MRHPPETGHPATGPRKRFRWKTSLGERSSVADARIEECVRDVHDDVGGQDEHRSHDSDAHHHGKSLVAMDRTASCPRPGSPKRFSVMNNPAMIVAKSIPSIVTIGVTAP